MKPAKPAQNVFTESFNGRFLDKYLNEHWSINIVDVRKIIHDSQ
ncbi:hypothetical protein EYB39_17335 [Pantoea agglomerans]|nr:hypothetical protein EYB39_17335 [Pantoea agglomerans]